MSCPRSPVARPLVTVGLAWCIAACLVATAWAQHGQFDKEPLNPRDEAAIFTPPGQEREGKPAVAEGPDAGHLNVTILDRATGRPTACRVNVVGADGNFYEPAKNSLAAFSLTGTWPERLAGNRPTKAPIRYFGHFFYTTGKFTVAVPAGALRIEVWKGFEYAPESLNVEIAAGATRHVELTIANAAPLAARGWHSGDPHLHFIRASDADETTVFDLLEAEDIRLGMVLCYNETNAYPGVMPELVTPQLRGLGRKSIRRRGDYQIISGQEYRNVVSGHLNLFLRDQLVLEGTKLDPNRGPAFGTIGAETREQGGYSFHAHGGYAQEIWADLVQGATDGVELLQFGIYRGIGLEGWYHVLGAGFRFPGVAACDYPACRKLGDCRTYVYIDGEANFPDWLAGAAQGRSFMTTGPLVLLEVDGHRPGDIIATNDSEPRSVKVRVTVESPTAPVTDVQLVVGGRVVRELKAAPQPGHPQKIELAETVTVDESSWIAARAFSKAPTGSPDAEAHTNPVYVYLNGKPPCRAADVDWLLARVDEQIADHEARKEPEKAASIDYFRRSREILLEMRRHGEPPAPPKRTAAAERGNASADSKPLVPPAATLRGDSLAEFLKPQAALSPAEALKSFEVQDGFRMELVAQEPDVTDPVAACFDENGGMYVAEMLDYPYRPKEGQTPLGRVRYLEDADGDGKYERSWIFADKLVWPTGVVCWKGGVYVAAAPDIWYLKDADGDHRADVIEKVYTGFGDRNQQGGVNNLNWHVDHKIYGSGSTNGGAIRRADKSDASPIVLSSRDFRFDPVTGGFETVSGSKQFGNAFDDWFNRFLCSESKPAYHVVLAQHYLARNPNLAVPTALNDLAPGVTPIFRTSPIERWRQVRSSRRLVAGERSPESAGLSHNVIDAAAGLTIYRGHAYPAEYLGNLFIGCSQNNLVHRRRLTAEGPTFRSERADANTEFVRSTDTWFRPVNCINAPDGTLYVLDMSREVIESIHIAGDVVQHLDLTNGRDKGRIYRLAPPGFVPLSAPRLGQATTVELVGYLEHPGGWWRDTAGRLIFERQDLAAVEPLRRRLAQSPSALGRMHILWALDGFGALDEQDLLIGLADAAPGVREHAVRLAEPRLNKSRKLVDKLLALGDDPDARVRFQVAFSLGEVHEARAVEALAAIAARDAADAWTRTAVLSSCVDRSHRVLDALVHSSTFIAQPTAPVWCEQLATVVGARNKAEEVNAVLDAAAGSAKNSSAQLATVMGLGAGLQRSGGSLSAARTAASPASAAMLDQLLQQAMRTARDAKSPVPQRQESLRVLSLAGGIEARDALAELIEPHQPEALQVSAVKILTHSGEPRVAERLIASWRASTPKLQEEIIAALASRSAWAGQLLDACDEKRITAGQVTAGTRTALVSHQDTTVRDHAAKVFGQASSRAEVIAGYQSALASPGDALRGEKVYERECMACHRLGERGFQVGPNLALIRNRTPQALLDAILDPNREVQPSYVNYVVTDDAGRTVSGLIVAETANSITLARDKGASDTLQKSNIEEITSTGKSLMPEGLERTVDPQGLADLLAFLKQVQYDIGTLPDFAEPKMTFRNAPHISHCFGFEGAFMVPNVRFHRLSVTTAIVLIVAVATSAKAADEAQIAAALARPVLKPGQPLREIKAFIEPRIIKLPPFSDRASWEKYAAQLRRDMLEQIVFRGSAARWRDMPCRVEWLDTIGGGPGYQIRKFRYECLSGLWIPGLLYLPDNLTGKVPLAVHVNGHAPEGKAVEYKQLRSINLAKRGLLVLDLEWFGMGQLRTGGFSHYRMNQLDLCGASGLAPFYLAMSRALDIGLALPNVDPKRVAVSGLSGGGWQTILISSLDERVALANPVAGYGSFVTNIAFDDMGDSEQAPSDMALVADYAHLTALRAPRPTLLTYNAGDDCCFKSGHTLEPLLQAARPLFELHGAGGKLRSHVNHVPGTHNFEQENREQLYAMLGDFFYPQDKGFARTEIPSKAEIKTAAELHVPLPEDNLDFHRLAVGLLAEVPRDPRLPTERQAAETWQRERREHLIALLKAPQYEVTAAENSGESWKLKLGQSWTVPVVEFATESSKPRGIALVMDDRGRAGAGSAISRCLAAGEVVLAVDPLLWGESKIKAQDPDYLYPLFVAAVGERTLGIQAAQLAGIARWLRERHPNLPLTLVAEGPRSSVAALVAAAIEPKAISAAELTAAPASLKQLIEEDKTVETVPELFAFGLLAEFDVRQIVALSAPRPITFRAPDDRARRELEPLTAWYALFGRDFQPAR